MKTLRDAEGVAHIVALSGGKDSTAMALRLAEVRVGVPFVFVCTPTGSELPEMAAHFEHLKQVVAPNPFISITGGLTLHGLIDQYNALPNWRMRWCTRQLKIEPFKALLLNVRPAVSYVGLRADETTRAGAIYGDMDDITQSFPLQEWGWKKRDVVAYLESKGVSVPQRTDCGQCFYQTLGEWWSLWRDYPSLYATYEKQETETGHTYRSDQRDTWPASLTGLRAEFESGKTPRGAPVQTDAFSRAPIERHCRVCSL
jgi:3'-phosphoadenosine 5'-phosphosulfate sulfotransferase (PAPS reductase)/FAD synthetase